MPPRTGPSPATLVGRLIDAPETFFSVPGGVKYRGKVTGVDRKPNQVLVRFLDARDTLYFFPGKNLVPWLLEPGNEDQGNEETLARGEQDSGSDVEEDSEDSESELGESNRGRAQAGVGGSAPRRRAASSTRGF